jgi:hypothetical protein
MAVKTIPCEAETPAQAASTSVKRDHASNANGSKAKQQFFSSGQRIARHLGVAA